MKLDVASWGGEEDVMSLLDLAQNTHIDTKQVKTAQELIAKKLCLEIPTERIVHFWSRKSFFPTKLFL